MQRTRIKFCGITTPRDAIAAAMTGADAIGLVFYDRSPRHLSMERAAEILAALPPMVTPVALFVNASPVEILKTSRALNIRTVQLHGDEPADYLSQLPGLTIIKAIRCTAENMASLHQWRSAAAILLDTANTPHPGGSGIENNWAAVESAIKSGSFQSALPVIAAGGLTPENVANVIARIHPYAVDVSSGIEESPGIKSAEKMQRFADAVRNCRHL